MSAPHPVPLPIRCGEGEYKLTAAINRAKDAGDIQTLREIAEDPHGYILRQGWGTLDFSDVEKMITSPRPSPHPMRRGRTPAA